MKIFYCIIIIVNEIDNTECEVLWIYIELKGIEIDTYTVLNIIWISMNFFQVKLNFDVFLEIE